jgi:hypothetical protein
MPHPFGIAGLVLSMLASLLLLGFPPDAGGYDKYGVYRAPGQIPVAPTKLGQFRYKFLKNGFRIAMGFLFVGFALQLVDLLSA